jgi:hypothetical protein
MSVKYIIDNSDDSLSNQTINGDLSVTNKISGDGSKISGVVGLTYSDMGFTITSPAPSTINQNVTLPYNSTLTYNGPLSVGSGFTIIIPVSTTLDILP